MKKYIQKTTTFPDYYQFPKFLLEIPISQTAKLIYMVLYNRARLSQSHDWLSNDRVYMVYPIKKLAKIINRSETTVKSALNELRSVELLHSEDGGFSRANHLFVLLPDVSFSDPVENMSIIETENQLIQGQISLPHEDRNPSSSNKDKLENPSKEIRVKSYTHLGRYKNISLTSEEYESLHNDYPDCIDNLIEEMSSYCAARGTTYSNYEACLRRWAEKRTHCSYPSFKQISNYDFKEGESF